MLKLQTLFFFFSCPALSPDQTLIFHFPENYKCVSIFLSSCFWASHRKMISSGQAASSRIPPRAVPAAGCTKPSPPSDPHYLFISHASSFYVSGNPSSADRYPNPRCISGPFEVVPAGVAPSPMCPGSSARVPAPR